jgi:CRISP-associated protein Cas1
VALPAAAPEVLPHRDIAVLRGIEGARVKVMYQITAQRFGLTWSGRRYDRANPNATDLPNQAINHAASAVEAAAAIAVTATATIPQLGFIHEDSGQSFVLDVADLYRDTVTVPEACQGTDLCEKGVPDMAYRYWHRSTSIGSKNPMSVVPCRSA